MLKPRTLRADPEMVWLSESESTIVGRLYFSLRRLATIPMTPLCQEGS